MMKKKRDDREKTRKKEIKAGVLDHWRESDGGRAKGGRRSADLGYNKEACEEIKKLGGEED